MTQVVKTGAISQKSEKSKKENSGTTSPELESVSPDKSGEEKKKGVNIQSKNQDKGSYFSTIHGTLLHHYH